MPRRRGRRTPSNAEDCMIRGVIFDLDGTLGDTLPVCYRAFARVLGRRLGRPFSDTEIHSMFGPSEEGILARLCPADPEGALEEYLAEYRAAHAECPRPFRGIPQALQTLRRHGVRLAIVTGKGPRSARISLDAFGLGRFFPLVEAGSPDGGVKPAAMRRVLRRWGFKAREAVAVGDSPSDVRSAKEVGITSVAAAWAPGADAEGLAACGPDRLFTDPSGLLDWLQSALLITR